MSKTLGEQNRAGKLVDVFLSSLTARIGGFPLKGGSGKGGIFHRRKKTN